MIIDMIFGKKLTDYHYKSIRLDRKTVEDTIDTKTKIELIKNFLSDAYLDMSSDTDFVDDCISAINNILINFDTLGEAESLTRFNDLLSGFSYRGYYCNLLIRRDLMTESINENFRIIAYLINPDNSAFGIISDEEEKGSLADVVVGLVRSCVPPTSECESIFGISKDLSAYDLLDSSNQGYAYDVTSLMDYLKSKSKNIVIIHFE